MLRDDSSLFEIFIEDLLEQISHFDVCLLALEKNPVDPDALNSLFRVFHSIKGLFYTMEYQEIGDCFHRLETIVQGHKNQITPLEQAFIGLVMDLRDQIELFINEIKDNRNINSDMEAFNKRLDIIETATAAQNLALGISEEHLALVPPRKKLYESLKKTELLYLQMIDSEKKIIDPFVLKKAFDECLALSAQFEDRHLNDLFQQACRFLDYYVDNQLQLEHISEGLIMETFDWAMKLLDLTHRFTAEENRHLLVHLDMMQPHRVIYLQKLSEETYREPNGDSEKLGEILVKSGVIDEDSIESIINLQKSGDVSLKLGEALVSQNMVKVKDIAGALQVQKQIRKDNDNYTFIRIPERKIDVLVDNMEELMIMQTQLKEKLRKRWNESDSGTKMQLDRIDKMLILLQNQAMSFRMQTLESTLKKAELIGISTAKDLKKDVEIQINGLEVEASRSLIEHLQNSILHLVRNAIYHGIETSDVRVGMGKRSRGLLHISGNVDQSHLTISISDDGKGLELDKILNRAVEMAIADPQKDYATWEIIDFIFEPGFSTLEVVNNVSGRGLGMNIVETEVKALGGHIEIQNRPDAGVTFILKIPLHTQNLFGQVVELGLEKLIIPTENIFERIEGEEVEWVVINDKCQRIVFGSEVINLVAVDRLLDQNMELDMIKNSQVVILRHKGMKLALPVKTIGDEIGVYVNDIQDIKAEPGIFRGVAVINEHEFALIVDVEKMFFVQNN